MLKSFAAAVFIAASISVAHAGNSSDPDSGAVFIMTNSAQHNEVLTFARAKNGTLTATGRVSTDGRGSGGTTDPLGSQGSLTLSSDSNFLFAVNAGSGSVSSFRVSGDDLKLVDVAPSGGSAPVAVAQWGSFVYVLNFAGNSSVVGFYLEDDGHLSKIPNSIRYLSTANSGASSLAFTPDGKSLLVTEKLTNLIDVFPVMGGGQLGTPVVTTDAKAGLFDLTVAPSGIVYSLEAAAGTISSFMVDANESLFFLNSKPTLGSGTCWNVVTPNGKWIYTANSASNSISGYGITSNGGITPVAGTVVAQLPASTTDLDLAVSADSKYLYSLNSSSGTIGTFKIKADGSLQILAPLTAFTPASGLNGIAAY